MKLKYNEKVHGYWLDGVRCKGVSTLAKIPDNTFNLDKWRQRQLAVGLALRPDYIEIIASHFDQDGTVDEYVDKAIEAAQASKGANTGIAMHRVTERKDTGKTIIETALSAYAVRSWEDALEQAGLEVAPEYIEACVVYPSRKIAGRFDRYLRRKSDGRLVVADLKTGAKAIKFPHSMACQLGLYANAPLVARNIVADKNGDFETEDFEEAPDIDKEIGYIFHIPINDAPMVAEIDIDAGWKAVERVIFPTLAWRDRAALCWPIKSPPPAKRHLTPTSETEWPVRDDKTADPTQIIALEKRYMRLDGDAKAWVDNIVAEAHAAGTRLSLSSAASPPSERVYKIGLALVRFATISADDALLRGALTVVLGEEPQLAIPLGTTMSALFDKEAEALNDIALAIYEGKCAIRYLEDGTVSLPAA